MAGAHRKVDISRFKGLGEMMPADLKDTTMNPKTRTLARVVLTDAGAPDFENLVETPMGKKAELRSTTSSKTRGS